MGGDSYNSRSSRSNRGFQLGSALRWLGTILPRVTFRPSISNLRQPTLASSGPSFVIQTKLFRATAAAAAAIWTAGWAPKRAGSAPRKYLPTQHAGNPIHPPLSVPHIQRSCLEQQPGYPPGRSRSLIPTTNCRPPPPPPPAASVLTPHPDTPTASSPTLDTAHILETASYSNPP